MINPSECHPELDSGSTNQSAGFRIKSGTTNQTGYIALISAIIISALLLIITFYVNFSIFFARFNILDSEYKKISVGLAEACADTAILEIAKETPVADNTCVNVGDSCGPPPGPKTCKICQIRPLAGPGEFEIMTRAGYQDSVTNFVIDVTRSSTNVTVDSWEEVASYSGVSCPLP
ncbi:MAG: hypothetical protein Q8R08_02405 [bacterium]|nr:hypothetical protein [bacterium]